MSDQVPTVTIKNPNSDGYLVINESDFDADVHELFESAETSSEPTEPVDLSKLKKDELLEEAERRGVAVDASMTKAEIIAALGGE